MIAYESIRSDHDEIYDPAGEGESCYPVAMRAITPPSTRETKQNTVFYSLSSEERHFWSVNFLPWMHLSALCLGSAGLNVVSCWFAKRAWKVLNRAWFPKTHSWNNFSYVVCHLDDLNVDRDWRRFEQYIKDTIRELYQEDKVVTLRDLCVVLWTLADLPVGHCQLSFEEYRSGKYDLPEGQYQADLRKAIYGDEGSEIYNPFPLESAIKAVHFVLESHVIGRCGERVPYRFVPENIQATIDVTYMVRAQAAQRRGDPWLKWVGSQGMHHFDKLLVEGGHYHNHRVPDSLKIPGWGWGEEDEEDSEDSDSEDSWTSEESYDGGDEDEDGKDDAEEEESDDDMYEL